VLLFALWVWKLAAQNEIKLRENPLYAPMLAFGAVPLLQLVFGWSAYRHDTLSQALLYLAYGLLAFLGEPVPAAKHAGGDAGGGRFCIRRWPGGLRIAPGALIQRQEVLDSPNARRRLVLWPLRQRRSGRASSLLVLPAKVCPGHVQPITC
jgi:hypothetical protein